MCAFEILGMKELGARYRREGYAIIRGLLDERQRTCLRTIVDTLDGQHHVVARFANRLIVTRNLRGEPELDAIARELAPVAACMMAQPQVRLLDDLLLVKPPRQEGGESTIWHQDAPNFPFDRRGFLTIWIAVDDIPLDRGPLTFLPGSHRLGPLGASDGSGEDTPLEALLTAEDWGCVGQPVTEPLAAGDASIHDGYMLHAAAANQTDLPRRAWGVRFIPASTLYTGGSHRSFDSLGLEPFKPFENASFPLFTCPIT